LNLVLCLICDLNRVWRSSRFSNRICIKKGNESHAYNTWFNSFLLSGIVNITNGDIPAEVTLGGGQLISATLTNYGIPITGSLAAGFVVGFMKG